jgi:hypothetical protein
MSCGLSLSLSLSLCVCVSACVCVCVCVLRQDLALWPRLASNLALSSAYYAGIPVVCHHTWLYHVLCNKFIFPADIFPGR